MDKKCVFPLKSKKQIQHFVSRNKPVKYGAKQDALVEELKFKTRQETELFVGLVLWLANKLWHHPQVSVGWNKVTLSLRTHDSGGITQKDFEFFEKLHEILILK